jgi:hypothetical protein
MKFKVYSRLQKTSHNLVETEWKEVREFDTLVRALKFAQYLSEDYVGLLEVRFGHHVVWRYDGIYTDHPDHPEYGTL